MRLIYFIECVFYELKERYQVLVHIFVIALLLTLFAILGTMEAEDMKREPLVQNEIAQTIQEWHEQKEANGWQ